VSIRGVGVLRVGQKRVSVRQLLFGDGLDGEMGGWLLVLGDGDDGQRLNLSPVLTSQRK
jgi:hypothetical protein